jgi:hypothetical protein
MKCTYQKFGTLNTYMNSLKSEPQNIEYRMSKGGFASLSLFYKIDRIHYFDIRHSLFYRFYFDLTGRILSSGWAEP